MDFLDEVKKVQVSAKPAPTQQEKDKQEIDAVVDELIKAIKKHILVEAGEYSNRDGFRTNLYFCVPNGVGHHGLLKLWHSKTIHKGSGFSYCYEFSTTESLSYLKSTLSEKLGVDGISVSDCLVGTTANTGLVSAKKIDSRNLGKNLRYWENDYYKIIIDSAPLNIYSIYKQFDASAPIYVERKNKLFGGVVKTISQSGIAQEILDAEDFAYLLKVSFSAK